MKTSTKFRWLIWITFILLALLHVIAPVITSFYSIPMFLPYLLVGIVLLFSLRLPGNISLVLNFIAIHGCVFFTSNIIAKIFLLCLVFSITYLFIDKYEEHKEEKLIPVFLSTILLVLFFCLSKFVSSVLSNWYYAILVFALSIVYVELWKEAFTQVETQDSLVHGYKY